MGEARSYFGGCKGFTKMMEEGRNEKEVDPSDMNPFNGKGVKYRDLSSNRKERKFWAYEP